MKNDLTSAEWEALASFLHFLNPLLITNVSPMISTDENKQIALLVESGKEKFIKIAKEMGGTKMNLAEKLKEAKHESFDKWFERWYKEQDLEKQLIVAASQGNSEFRIGIQEDYERVSKFSDRKVYLNRRLRDDRTVEKISNELGEGIKVEYIKDKKSTNFLGMTRYYFSDWIEITWRFQ